MPSSSSSVLIGDPPLGGPRAVCVRPYNPSWPAAFAAERTTLSTLLGPAALVIHHVGSTAVPGLAAKPVLDILLETPSLQMIDEATPALIGRDYDARGSYGIEGRRYFSRRAAPGLGVHLHAFESGHECIVRHLCFRDYLRAHAEEAARYAELKLELAARHSDDRDAYQAGKAAFIEEVLRQAAAWAAP